MTKNEVWNIDELVALTDEVQTGTTEYNGKKLIFQYCELTEGEEPKLKFPSAGASQEEQNEAYKKIGQARILAMLLKANEKNPKDSTITKENWNKLPSTIRWGISNEILGSADGATFRDVDDTSA
jgi:hypothetical protein